MISHLLLSDLFFVFFQVSLVHLLKRVGSSVVRLIYNSIVLLVSFDDAFGDGAEHDCGVGGADVAVASVGIGAVLFVCVVLALLFALYALEYLGLVARRFFIFEAVLFDLFLVVFQLFRVDSLWRELVLVLYSNRCARFAWRILWYPLEKNK